MTAREKKKWTLLGATARGSDERRRQWMPRGAFNSRQPAMMLADSEGQNRRRDAHALKDEDATEELERAKRGRKRKVAP